jgi:hypothetical protein
MDSKALAREQNMSDSSLCISQFYTKHAEQRAQQRSIPPYLVDLLLNFGKLQRSHHADLYLFDKTCKRKLRRHLGSHQYFRIEDQLDCWAVVGDDGAVISIGHRTRRFKH